MSEQIVSKKSQSEINNMASTKISFTCDSEKLQKFQELAVQHHKSVQEMLDWLIDIFNTKEIVFPTIQTQSRFTVQDVAAIIASIPTGNFSAPIYSETANSPGITKRQEKSAPKSSSVASPDYLEASQSWKILKEASKQYLEKYGIQTEEWFPALSRFVSSAVIGRVDSSYSNGTIWKDRHHEARSVLCLALSDAFNAEKGKIYPLDLCDRVLEDLRRCPIDPDDDSEGYENWASPYYDVTSDSLEAPVKDPWLAPKQNDDGVERMAEDWLENKFAVAGFFKNPITENHFFNDVTKENKKLVLPEIGLYIHRSFKKSALDKAYSVCPLSITSTGNADNDRYFSICKSPSTDGFVNVLEAETYRENVKDLFRKALTEYKGKLKN